MLLIFSVENLHPVNRSKFFLCLSRFDAWSREKKKNRVFLEKKIPSYQKHLFFIGTETSLKKYQEKTKNKIKQIYMLIVGILRRIGRQWWTGLTQIFFEYSFGFGFQWVFASVNRLSSFLIVFQSNEAGTWGMTFNL